MGDENVLIGLRFPVILGCSTKRRAKLGGQPRGPVAVDQPVCNL